MFIFRQHLSRVRNLTPDTDYTLIGVDSMRHRFSIYHGEEIEEYENSYSVLNKKSVDHFAYKYSVDEVMWLKYCNQKSVKRLRNLDYRI